MTTMFLKDFMEREAAQMRSDPRSATTWHLTTNNQTTWLNSAYNGQHKEVKQGIDAQHLHHIPKKIENQSSEL